MFILPSLNTVSILASISLLSAKVSFFDNIEQLSYYSTVMQDTPANPHKCPSGLGDKVLSFENAKLVAGTFQVLGDPTRVRIVHALSLSELCTSDLASVVDMSESAVSHQLRTLRQLAIVVTRREGKLVYYSLKDDHIRSLFRQGLEHALEREEHRR